MVLNEDLSVTIKKKNLDKFKIKLVYETPIVSPVKKGDKLAELQLIEGDNVKIKNIYSGKDIDKVSRFYRSFSIINYLLKQMCGRPVKNGHGQRSEIGMVAVQKLQTRSAHVSERLGAGVGIEPTRNQDGSRPTGP